MRIIRGRADKINCPKRPRAIARPNVAVAQHFSESCVLLARSAPAEISGVAAI
jgi:hypothetical protein